ncbi:hypothetical protein DVH24_025777 [Malus domestica]|uniref:Uncharacterized protein n=1 Tax=Malus domestica TaxID=3750 RepID=A0A498KHK1_MALDO|nr:hypothetical protein DVH24_025777 [Malus domestica]
MQPVTPKPFSREIIVSSTTVSSSTSTTETTEQLDKQKKKSIRKALFTVSEQNEIEEISDADPREFYEVPIKLLKTKKIIPTGAKLDTTHPKRKKGLSEMPVFECWPFDEGT